MKELAIRPATVADAAAIFALIQAYREEGRLLPRTLADLRKHANRFLVGDVNGRLVACAELAPLSANVAEIRSLVVDRDFRSNGLAAKLVAGLSACAQAIGFDRLTAFTHDTRFFLKMGFLPVKHAAVPEKIAKDCVRCPLFNHCDQYAMALPLHVSKPRQVRRPVRRPAAAPAPVPA